MGYIALYNKYRPQEFDDVVGQDKTVYILKNSIACNKIANGYLFIGNRGLGKTTLAKIFSKALNCTSDGHIPCNKCPSCVDINADKSFDVVELDAASNRGVDTVRDVIINKVNFKPRGQYKVYIIDECHMFTVEAWNALLKTLEQPPSYCVFIFCTTNPEKIPKTIISRVQTFKLKDIDNNDIVKRLEYICKEENLKYKKDALYAIARYSNGGMRDSISALDQLSSFNDCIDMESVSAVLGLVNDDICCELFKNIIHKEYEICVNIINDIVDNGKNLNDVFDVLCVYVRTYIKLISNCEIKNSDISEYALDFISDLTSDKKLDYHYLVKLLIDNERNLKYSKDKVLVMINLISRYIDGDVKKGSIDKSLLERISKLENNTVSNTPKSSTDNIKNNIKQKLEVNEEEVVDESCETIIDSIERWLNNGGRKIGRN